jgi:RND family efflux transporter MFP subunit
MNVPPPQGTIAVELAPAKFESFAPTVTYSGQAVGYAEQDIVARVTGTIVWMPGYVGDPVTKDQVLAQLDTSSLAPEVAMKQAALARARQGVGVSKLEHEVARSEADQARAEAMVAERDVAEAQAMAEAAAQARVSANAEIASSQAEVNAMRAEQRSAQADREYADAEFGRAQTLFEKGAISRDEFQQAKAERDKARAMVEQASQKVLRANGMLAAAKAMAKRSESEQIAAQRGVEKASAMVLAKKSMITKAQREAEAARARIGQESAMAAESAAGLRGATAQLGYATLRSPNQGMILKRLVSPGQLVSAGQPILRIAQVSPLRIQANVAEGDLGRLSLGAGVRIKVGQKLLTAKVQSISPGVDPTSRTGVVEAVLPNEDLAVRPGQYVSMEIEAGAGARRLTIPRDAVRNDPSSPVVFVSQTEAGGLVTVSQRKVQLGEGDGGRVVVVEGLKENEQVVLNPSPDLRDGARVTTIAKAGAVAKSEHTILVTEQGYEPASLTVPTGKPVTLTFIRKVDPSCGDTLSFPSLGVDRKLPLNTPVKVEITAQKVGKIRFVCGMEMYKGVVVVE